MVAGVVAVVVLGGGGDDDDDEPDRRTAASPSESPVEEYGNPEGQPLAERSLTALQEAESFRYVVTERWADGAATRDWWQDRDGNCVGAVRFEEDEDDQGAEMVVHEGQLWLRVSERALIRMGADEEERRRWADVVGGGYVTVSAEDPRVAKLMGVCTGEAFEAAFEAMGLTVGASYQQTDGPKEWQGLNTHTLYRFDGDSDKPTSVIKVAADGQPYPVFVGHNEVALTLELSDFGTDSPLADPPAPEHSVHLDEVDIWAPTLDL
jgi:hypothetical protein